MQKKLCIIYNTAPRYREAIFCAIDKEYDCDWFFGETRTDIKEMDISLLKSVKYYNVTEFAGKIKVKHGILRLLFSNKYDTFLILAESRSIIDYVFVLLAGLLNKTVYGWSHGWYGKESSVESCLKKWLFKRLKGVFVYSNYGRELMIEQGIHPDKLFTIHNSLHYDQHKVLRDSITPSDIYKKYFNNDYLTIIFIGRLTKVKKLDMLVEALFKLKNRGEEYNLVFVGDGTEKECLQQMVVRLGIKDNVWFYGACYEERINAELIYNADLCVAPGNIGLTAMHAMVFGCPCISHNTFKLQMPEFEAIHSGVTGSFFEMDNIDSLVDTISIWFKEKANRREEVRRDCFKEIDTQWNPYFQIAVIKKNLILK